MYNDKIGIIDMDNKRFTNDCELLSDITAVILAGGLGTRLRTVIGHTQKVMANVGERPFLEKILKQISESGITKAILCTGFMAEQVESHFGNKFENVNLKYSVEQLMLGTAGALRFALSQIESHSFLVMNGDSHCDANLVEFFETHQKRNALASMMLVEVPDTQRYGRVEFDDQYKIKYFEEKGAVKGPGWINAGIYLLSKQVLVDLPKGHNISLERDVFSNLIGNAFYAHCGKSSSFIDIGIPESYEAAGKLFADKKDIKK